MINPNDQAYSTETCLGMSIRTYIATQAMQAILSHFGSTSKVIDPDDPARTAAAACRYADAIIAELNKESQL